MRLLVHHKLVAGVPSLRTAFFLAALLSTALPPTIALAATAQSNIAIRVISRTRLGGGILPVDRDASGNWQMATSSGSAGATGATGSDPTSGVLPSYNDAYANWKNAGLLSVGGIPTRTTVCATVNPKGGGADDLADIQNAINICPAGEVVQLGAGTFTISMSEHINLDRGITLRGSGTCTNSSSPYCATVINVYNGLLAWTAGQCGTSTSSKVSCVSNPAIQVEPAAMVNLFDLMAGPHARVTKTVASTSCGAVALAADAAQGQTTIQVTSTVSFSVGMWVLD